MFDPRDQGQLNSESGRTGFSQMVGLKTNRGGDGSNASSQAVSNDSTASGWTRVPLSRPIEIGFMPVFRGEGPRSLLSSFDTVFFPGFDFPSVFYVSVSSYEIILYHETINFLCYDNLRGFSISEDPVVALLPDSPAKVWEDPGTQNLGVQTFVVATPLFEEFLDTGRRAPVEVYLGSQKTPHPRRKGAVNEDVIDRFQVILTEEASAGNSLASLG